MKEDKEEYFEVGPIVPDDERDWEWFKTFVRQMRGLNDRLLYGSSSHIMVTISLIDRDIGEWVEMNPHAIDLRGQALKYDKHGLDLKRLFLTKRSGRTPPEEYDR